MNINIVKLMFLINISVNNLFVLNNIYGVNVCNSDNVETCQEFRTDKRVKSLDIVAEDLEK